MSFDALRHSLSWTTKLRRKGKEKKIERTAGRPVSLAFNEFPFARFSWDVFGHPSYSPDLTPSDFHLFLHLKSFLAGKHFNNDKELKENVSNWLKTQAATFYEEGIEKLMPRYDTCLQNFGSYVER
ncbi:histone-lysine N-methyltransferase SETMAR [Trichonephila clavipes]|nr:histone-lysine N-methyltransferase SETMAR [Trichonephila clavipes]